ncbi:MAG TPA: hypothetical protein DDW20_01090 [Firmicutes bacterium]|nr:hypothetical protein [Bacillota bacterium]
MAKVIKEQKEKVVESVETKKQPKSDGKYYVISKSDKGWEVKLAQTKGAAGKIIKTLKTKPEAEAYVNSLTDKNGRSAVIHNSKGANKGRATKVAKK